MNDIKTMKPLKVKDTKSIRNLVATVRGFIRRMEDFGASDEAKSRYVFADILAKLIVEDQRAYARNMIDKKKIKSLHTLLEYLEEEEKIMVNQINALQKLGFILLMWTVVTMVPLVVVWVVPNNMF